MGAVNDNSDPLGALPLSIRISEIALAVAGLLSSMARGVVVGSLAAPPAIPGTNFREFWIASKMPARVANSGDHFPKTTWVHFRTEVVRPQSPQSGAALITGVLPRLEESFGAQTWDPR